LIKEDNHARGNESSQTNYPSVKRAVDKLGKRRTWRGIQMDSGGEPGDALIENF